MPVEIKLHYEALLGLLEAAYAGVGKKYPSYGEGARTAWESARRALFEEHGWTEKAFYEEMDARRKSDHGASESGG